MSKQAGRDRHTEPADREEFVNHYKRKKDITSRHKWWVWEYLWKQGSKRVLEYRQKNFRYIPTKRDLKKVEPTDNQRYGWWLYINANPDNLSM